MRRGESTQTQYRCFIFHLFSLRGKNRQFSMKNSSVEARRDSGLIFCYVTTCSSIHRYQRFGELCCLRLQDDGGRRLRPNVGTIYPTTWNDIPEEHNLNFPAITTRERAWRSQWRKKSQILMRHLTVLWPWYLCALHNLTLNDTTFYPQNLLYGLFASKNFPKHH
jgi:hypothetical protein